MRGRVLACALALVALTPVTACGNTGNAESAAPPSPTTMPASTTLATRAFADAVRARDLHAVKATFADDIRLYSPVLAKPFVGKARVDRLFDVLINVFKEIQITNEFESPHNYVLSFDSHVGAEPIRIVDLLTFDDAGRIKTFVVTARPLAGIEALAGAVAPHLGEIN
jgi:hypothetical protein